MSREFLRAVCVSAVLALLAACGQAGDLYLPEPPADDAREARP